MAETDTLSYNGVGFVESQDRVDEYRSGVGAKGSPSTLFLAPVKRTSMIAAVNTGKEACVLRLKHQGAVKTVTNENITAFAQGGNKYVGRLQFGAITPSSVSITNAGAPATVVDDGLGNLFDTGFIGVAAKNRGTVNYTTGDIVLQYGAGPTEPVRASYTDLAPVDFQSAAQVITDAGGANPHTIQLQFGRVVPGSILLDDGTHTWADDGKGNLIQTDATIGIKGTVDYATGTIVKTAGTAIGAVGAGIGAGSTFKYNPFAAVLNAAGSAKLFNLYSQIPELTNAVYAAGVKGETNLALVGEGNVASGQGTNIVTQWSHYSEEPYRVTPVSAGFPPGGHDNDPSLSQQVNHL